MTIDSALTQTYPNKEIIVVDDGSSDRTFQIARSFASRRVQVLHQENSGGPAARNTAFAHAQGEYIQWLDHDDLLAPNKIAEQLNTTEAGQSKRLLLSGPVGLFFYRPQKADFVPGALWRDLTPVEYFFAKFGGNTWLQSSCWLISRELSEAAGPWWDLRSPDDDGEYLCRVVAASERIHFVSEAKSFWRVGNYHSFSQARTPGALEALLKSTCRCIEHFRSLKDTESSRLTCVKFLQDRLILFYPERPELVAQMCVLANELGGSLAPPPLKWKYEVIKSLGGWRLAKKCLILTPRVRVCVLGNWDRCMHGLSEW